MKHRRNAEPDQTALPSSYHRQRWRARLASFHLREHWWNLLDHWESHAALRRRVYGALAILLVLVGTGLWAYPQWHRHNTIRVARQWLESGHYRYAVDAVQEAMVAAPQSPEPWVIAAELAHLGGQDLKALGYMRHAVDLAPDNQDNVITWAAAALRTDSFDEADRALDQLPVAVQAASPYVQRLRGELARRQHRLTAAKGFFESAVRLEGPLAINEVPLGLVLLNASAPAVRQRGLDLLAKWSADRLWGASAQRALLADATARADRPAMVKWAEALRANPDCTVADMPNCLLALAQADEPRFARVLAALEKDHAVSPKAAAQLLSWLNQIGRGREAVAWIKTLPVPAMRRPPLVVEAAEAYRLAQDWPALQEWTQGQDWGDDVEFLRWTYGLLADRKLGDRTEAESLWQTLYNHAQLNGAHALFAAATLYSWGLVPEATSLWQRAAQQEGQIALDALGALARLYQTQRDADGQYRVFRQLHSLQPSNRAVSNNFAFFAALTNREQRVAEELARANVAAEPQNPTYLATLAFVHFQQNRMADAQAVLRPVAADAAKSPALAFSYGLILAASGQPAKAHALLDGLAPATLTLQEVALIKATLTD